jgi:hypothetical protein
MFGGFSVKTYEASEDEQYVNEVKLLMAVHLLPQDFLDEDELNFENTRAEAVSFKCFFSV